MWKAGDSVTGRPLSSLGLRSLGKHDPTSPVQQGHSYVKGQQASSSSGQGEHRKPGGTDLQQFPRVSSDFGGSSNVFKTNVTQVLKRSALNRGNVQASPAGTPPLKPQAGRTRGPRKPPHLSSNAILTENQQRHSRSTTKGTNGFSRGRPARLGPWGLRHLGSGRG